jgi:photosystem II stability/assembly factor-like uncharacterized protein
MAKVTAQWQVESLPPHDSKYAFNLTTLRGTAADDLWLGASAYNLHFDGTAWTPVVNKAGRQRAWWEVSAVSKRDVWAVGPKGSVAHYDGTAWTEQQLAGIEYDLLHVLAFANQEVWVTAGPAGLVRFDGKQWTPVTAPALQGLALHRLWGTSPQDVYVQISQSDDGSPAVVHFDGHDFKSLTLGSEAGANYAVHGSSAQDVWAVGTRKKSWGRGGQILHFDGKAWTATPIPVDEVLWDVYAVSPTQAWACGKNGVILAWDGQKWTQSPSGTKESLGTIYVPPGGKAMALETARLLRQK